MALVNIGNGI